MVAKKRARPRPIHFETTIPVIRPCSRCGVWFAAGVAEGLKAEIELHSLDTLQILWAISRGIELYVMRRRGLIHMDTLRLSGPRLGALYPQHRCDIVWPVVTKPPVISLRPDVPLY